MLRSEFALPRVCIPGTEIYVDDNLSDMGVVALSHKALSLFGYKEKDLSIETK
jgi:hypothetical protein